FVPELPQFGLSSVGLDEALTTTDLAAIVTAHPGIDYAEVVATAPRTLDFRGVTRDIDSQTLERL
ncbi:MAG: UDP-N-acetyl-D-glucosamine dehydrogenase, partial [Solirubrobacterales bacterium]|nr:UDP-N-acetyl-D-glucosamine dehydrogenase [Solirubrobacterales bacterium]